jgi:hypothetical protein
VRRWRPSKQRINELVEQAIVDAYGEAEHRTGFFTMLAENLGLPFTTKILGVSVTVERVDLTDADEVVAICRSGRNRQKIPILNPPLPMTPPEGAEWIEAYRHWARGR